MNFCSLVLELHLPQNFCHTHRDTQTDRHFPKIVKSCSRNPKTCKSIKNRKSKICTKSILSSYVEGSKNQNYQKCSKRRLSLIICELGIGFVCFTLKPIIGMTDGKWTRLLIPCTRVNKYKQQSHAITYSIHMNV